MKKIELPEPISGGLLLSYKCTAECRHCMYGCSPKWRGDWISQEDLINILSGLAHKIKPSPWGPQTVSLNYGLHFTGGEPFLNFELLLKAVEIAHELKLPSSFVETNCYWCTNDCVTREKLELLKEKGLKGVLISVNYGNYLPGYCGGISLGDCRNLDKTLHEGIDLEERPVLSFLVSGDLGGLFQFAKDFGYQESPEGYLSKCHLCLDLRKHLVSKKEFEELTPKEFYLHLD